MTREEKQMLQKLNSYNHMESNETGTGLEQGGGNPTYVSQFDLGVKIIYVAALFAGTQNIVTPDNLPAQLKTKLSYYMFGKADSAGGFANNKQVMPVNNWTQGTSFIKGDLNLVEVSTSQETPFVPAVFNLVEAQMETGDLVQHFWYFDIATGDYYHAYVILTCEQVAYGTLLDSTSSDRFTISGLRFSVIDDSKVKQFANNIFIETQSLFGKRANDKVSLKSFQTQADNNPTIVLVPITKGVDKQTSLLQYLDYDVEQLDISVFVKTQAKVVA